MSNMEWDWIKGLFLALPTIASALTAWFVISGRGQTPQPFEVRGETRMATWEELESARVEIRKLDAAVAVIRDQIIDTERRLQTEGSRRAANLHKRMDEMDHDIDAVPGRVVALLRDTKGLI